MADNGQLEGESMVKTLYETDSVLKFMEIDNYANGCDPKSGRDDFYKIHFSAATVKDLIHELMNHAGSNDIGDVELNDCDEPGRVDIGVMERDDGITARKNDITLWKANKLKLWYVVYSFRVQKVTRETVELKKDW